MHLHYEAICACVLTKYAASRVSLVCCGLRLLSVPMQRDRGTRQTSSLYLSRTAPDVGIQHQLLQLALACLRVLPCRVERDAVVHPELRASARTSNICLITPALGTLASH